MSEIRGAWAMVPQLVPPSQHQVAMN